MVVHLVGGKRRGTLKTSIVSDDDKSYISVDGHSRTSIESNETIMISIMNRLNRMRNAINEIAFAERQGSVRIYDSSIELEFG